MGRCASVLVCTRPLHTYMLGKARQCVGPLIRKLFGAFVCQKLKQNHMAMQSGWKEGMKTNGAWFRCQNISKTRFHSFVINLRIVITYVIIYCKINPITKRNGPVSRTRFINSLTFIKRNHSVIQTRFWMKKWSNLIKTLTFIIQQNVY